MKLLARYQGKILHTNPLTPAIVRDLGALGEVRREIACGRSDEVVAEKSRKEMSRFVKWPRFCLREVLQPYDFLNTSTILSLFQTCKFSSCGWR